MIKNGKVYEVEELSNIREYVRRTVEKYQDKTAFIIKHQNGKEKTYENKTFNMVYEDMNSFATALINKLGLKDKRVAVIGRNRYEWCVTYLAVVNGVGVIVPLDKGLPEAEIELSLKRAKVEAVVFEDKYVEIMENIKQRGETNVEHYICMDNIENTSFISYTKLLEEGKEIFKTDKSYLDIEINEQEMSILVFTSGTTALSKGVMLSHKNIASNLNALYSIIKVDEKDTTLAFLPYHHTFGWTGQLYFFTKGTKTAYCDGIRHIQENLKEYKVSVFVCVPLLIESIYKKVNATIEEQGKTKQVKFGKFISKILLKFGIDIRRKIFKEVIDQLGGNIRLAVSGAAPIDKEVDKGFNEFGIRAIQGYGLTETSPFIAAENDSYIKYGSVGKVAYNDEVQIFEPNEKGIGEVIVKGPNVMLGYYENEEATNEVLIDGWFHTGDLGYFDKDETLYITGRKKNVIVLKNGKNIYPEELEVLINNLKYVTESMVFGYPKDDDYILSAKIVYNKEAFEKNMTEEDIYNKIWNDIKGINSGLTNYKHIKKLIVTDEPMIKTTTQKVKRFEEIKKILEED